MEIGREMFFSCTIATDVAHPPSELQNDILSATRELARRRHPSGVPEDWCAGRRSAQGRHNASNPSSEAVLAFSDSALTMIIHTWIGRSR